MQTLSEALHPLPDDERMAVEKRFGFGPLFVPFDIRLKGNIRGISLDPARSDRLPKFQGDRDQNHI